MINLDKLSKDELLAFWAKHQQGRQARSLFPEGGAGTRKATRDLANYAANMATAMQQRARGEEETAKMYEGIAESILYGLPEFACWRLPRP